jgi:hypothetical protein
MKSPERLVFHDQMGNSDGFANGFFTHFAIPLTHDFEEGKAAIQLFENDPHHDCACP